MKVVRSPAAMMHLAAKWDRPVVLVPTMGALHAGHLALVDRARHAAGRRGLVVVSIFVNPLQFGPQEDLSRYPRPLRRDLAQCRERGVDLVFHPAAADLYVPGRSVSVEESRLSAGLCGRSRPGHFAGVCTVVAKLFNLVRPHSAVFGQKDYQQLAIIQRMVRDLDFPLRIIGAEIVREPDGLALSSRNVYLTPAERAQAPGLRQALLRVQARYESGERSVARLRSILLKALATAPLGRLDYAEIVDADDLQPIRSLERPALAAVAVHFGRTRLIDNQLLLPAR